MLFLFNTKKCWEETTTKLNRITFLGYKSSLKASEINIQKFLCVAKK